MEQLFKELLEIDKLGPNHPTIISCLCDKLLLEHSTKHLLDNTLCYSPKTGYAVEYLYSSSPLSSAFAKLVTLEPKKLAQVKGTIEGYGDVNLSYYKTQFVNRFFSASVIATAKFFFSLPLPQQTALKQIVSSSPNTAFHEALTLTQIVL